jgi:hypothetical protein
VEPLDQVGKQVIQATPSILLGTKSSGIVTKDEKNLLLSPKTNFPFWSFETELHCR